MANCRFHIRRASAVAGLQRKLAEKMGSRRQSISLLPDEVRQVSAAIAVAIERDAGMMIGNEPRPDVFGAPAAPP